MFHLAARSLPFFANSISYRATSALSTKVKSLYSVFELPKDATHQEIKEAFYRLSKLYHPDVTDDPNARGKFHELMRAYEVLGNPIKRNEYDRGLIHPRSDRIDTDFEPYSIDSIRDSSKDNFKSFYVKQHNRILNESWERQADRELIMTAKELKEDHKLVVTVLLGTIVYGIFFSYLYSIFTEEPIEFVKEK
ncbi:unnamed protein product [Trichobilharzia szidati]|nr:unnamed protein product [Trichobilharzia szidati]